MLKVLAVESQWVLFGFDRGRCGRYACLKCGCQRFQSLALSSPNTVVDGHNGALCRPKLPHLHMTVQVLKSSCRKTSGTEPKIYAGACAPAWFTACSLAAEFLHLHTNFERVRLNLWAPTQ